MDFVPFLNQKNPMKNIIIALLFMIGLNSYAQNTDRSFMVLNEFKVKDMEVFRKNMSVMNPHLIERFKGILSSRTVQRSETGLMYSLSFISGAENLGKFYTMRYDGSDNFSAANPKIDQEMSANWDGSGRRSTWIRVNALDNLPEDYKVENYKFRRILIETIPAGQQEEYEKQAVEGRELQSKLGINMMSVTFRAVEGYPNNTYITFMQDTSIVDYYIHREERNQKRSASKEYGEFMKKRIKTNVIRMDHLFYEF